MKKKSSLRCGWRRAFEQIHPVDRSVILFLFVLLLQSAYTMFLGQPASQAAEEIDVIVRTSAAAIFGYVLSANFISHETNTEQSPSPLETHRVTMADDSVPQQETVVQVQTNSESLDGGSKEPILTNQAQSSCIQVMVATGIGLFCLVTLLVLRNTGCLDRGIADSSSSTATVVQFRDFVSGCVGFLIGHPTHPSNSTL